MDEVHFRRFSTHVALPNENGCMLWLACLDGCGYGMFGVKSNGRWRRPRAHRLAYEHFVGTIPNGLELDHLCRNRRCVNPKHLEPVTHRENVLRGSGIAAKYAARTHCKNGHLFDVSNTKWRGKSRICAVCSENRWRERLARKTRYVDNAIKTHCKHGHEFTKNNTQFTNVINKAGHVLVRRHCRICVNESQRRYMPRKSGEI